MRDRSVAKRHRIAQPPPQSVVRRGQIINRQVDVIRSNWEEVSELARMTAAERKYFWGRQFLNRYAFEGYDG